MRTRELVPTESAAGDGLSPASTVGRYKSILALVLKYARADVFASGLKDIEESEQIHVKEGRPEELAADLERLGPTFVKLGQMLSSRPDLIAEPYVDALTRLQDDVEPVPYDEIAAILDGELRARASKVFDEIEETPIAAASLGQVHAARLRDGREVVVKVQRPNIRNVIASDLKALERAAGVLDQYTRIGRAMSFSGLIAEFKRSLARELDYTVEADQLGAFRRSMEPFEKLVVPAPILDYTSERVLTMERIRGRKISAIHGVVLTDLDGEGLADELFRAYLHQVLVDGVFHADPHPGNILLTTDRRIAILDLGMVGYVGRGLQDAILKLLLAVSDGDGEEVSAHALSVSKVLDDGERQRFRSEVTAVVRQHGEATLERIDIGRVMLELYRIAADTGIQVPAELSLLGKTLMQLSEVGATLSPGFDTSRAIRRHALDVTAHRLKDGLSPGRILSGILDGRELLAQLPGDLRRLVNRLSEGDWSLELKPQGVEEIVTALRQAANRVAAGLVLAALIVGAALMMRVETEFSVLEYPGLALAFFLAAAAGGAVLLWSIYRQDR